MRKDYPYFFYSKRESIGIIIICVTSVIIALFPQFYQQYLMKEIDIVTPCIDEDSSFTEDEGKGVIKTEKKASHGKIDVPIIKTIDDGTHDAKSSSKSSITSFDPNKVTQSKLIGLGIPNSIANNWTKYLAAGGRFFKSEDLLKIYGMTPQIYESLHPYLLFPNIPKTRSKPITKIDINHASAKQLQTLRGIGPVLSARIVKFRKMKNGFSQLDDIKDTYGITDSLYQSIRPFLTISSKPPSPLLINTASLGELARNEFISYKKARAIIKFRENHGAFSNPQDILETGVIDSITWKLIQHDIRI